MRKTHTPSPVEFHNTVIYMVVHNGQPYVPMKPVVEGMGLQWGRQSQKIKDSGRYSHTYIPLQTPGGVQNTLCVPLKKINGWLYSVNPEKVKPELRDTIIKYQEESTQVLYEYWNNGLAENPRKSEKYGYFEKKSREFRSLKKIARDKKLSENGSIRFAARKMKERYGDPEGLFSISHLDSPMRELSPEEEINFYNDLGI